MKDAETPTSWTTMALRHVTDTYLFVNKLGAAVGSSPVVEQGMNTVTSVCMSVSFQPSHMSHATIEVTPSL